MTKRPTYNERFGATAAGRATLKGSGENPPLRQAAIPLWASLRTAQRTTEEPKAESGGETKILNFMYQCITQKWHDSAMETRNHSKNGASLKSQMSKENFKLILK